MAMSHRNPRGAGIVWFLLVAQSLMWILHGALYASLAFFVGEGARPWLSRGVFFLLSLSFLLSMGAARRWNTWLTRILQWTAALWMGWANYLLIAAVGGWVLWPFLRLAVGAEARPIIGCCVMTSATLATLFGLINARRLRRTHFVVQLENLPPVWRGRRIALLSDVHLGQIFAAGRLRRFVQIINDEGADLVAVAGDLFDGVRIDHAAALEPWRELAAPLGACFASGNHDEFEDVDEVYAAARAVGMRVLVDDAVEIEGVVFAGLGYSTGVHDEAQAAALEAMHLPADKPTILLHHAPHHLAMAENAGVGLALCGHTHGGQFWPSTWITRRLYREFAIGLQRHGSLQVVTSMGAGTWGPPLRLDSRSEIVFIELQ